MAQRRNSKSQAKKEVKPAPALSKNGRPDSGDAPSAPPAGQSWFSLVLVLALLGLWSSMAVVYFEVVDYDSVIGKLSAYDSDGDGDFDLDDAKVLLGLTSVEQPLHPPEDERSPEEDTGSEPESSETQTEPPPLQQQGAPAESEESHDQETEQSHDTGPEESHDTGPEESHDTGPEESHDLQSEEETDPVVDVESQIQAAVSLPPPPHPPQDDFIPDDSQTDSSFSGEVRAERIDSTGVLVEEPQPQETVVESGQYLTSSRFTRETEPTEEPEEQTEPESQGEPTGEPTGEHTEEPTAEPTAEPTIEPTGEHTAEPTAEPTIEPTGEHTAEPTIEPTIEPTAEPTIEPTAEPTGEHTGESSVEPTAEPSPSEAEPSPEPSPSDSEAEDKLQEKEKVKKKKPKLLNKFDKTIKSEIDAAEKLRKKGKVEEALQAFETLVQKYPQSPRARYGRAQCEDDVAEKRRSNEMLHRAINSYKEAAELPDTPPDLLRGALKRRAERQQFLGRTRGSLVTLERLVQMFPEDYSLKNDLGVAHLLLGDNEGAKAVYEQVLSVAPDDGFAKVHYGFILKSENKIAESIPYLKEGLESSEPGTDDGRFYFHLGDALQRVGDKDEAHRWYERGHQRGHFSSVWQRSLYNVKGLKAQPWWTPRETGYTDLVKTLERNWRMIRDEALTMMDSKSGLFVPEEENLRETGEWGQYTLWQQGRKAGSACQGVPKTCALMERFPEATGCKRGQIKFSVMHPGTHVWPHTGPTNCRLRMHLGLVIPTTGCRIRCTDSTREWEEGKVLIFDDSFEHEVWQDADSLRLIFIVDVWHPELTAYQRQTLSPI